LYSSHLTAWRTARDRGELPGLRRSVGPRRRGPTLETRRSRSWNVRPPVGASAQSETHSRPKSSTTITSRRPTSRPSNTDPHFLSASGRFKMPTRTCHDFFSCYNRLRLDRPVHPPGCDCPAHPSRL
jgi:hypothetical protein